jgi:archaellin
MEKNRDTMNNQGNLGLVAGILLVGLLLIGAVSASVIMNTTQNVTNPEQDLNTITKETVDDLCSYIQIKDILGNYQDIQKEQNINQIAILINTLVSQDIDLSTMTIQISNGEQLHLLFYSGKAAYIKSYSLFSHPLWGTIPESSYSVMSLIDDDNSMITNHLINKNTDRAFILIKIPNDMTFHTGTSLQVTLMPSPGMERTVNLEAPLPMRHIVSLYE